jgi:hypothetical protein
MIDDPKAIDEILSEAENIYELGRKREYQMLVYDDRKLYTTGPDGRLYYKPVCDIKYIDFNYDLNAWCVFWKV